MNMEDYFDRLQKMAEEQRLHEEKNPKQSKQAK
jgi:hypothetical protein